MNQNPDDNEDPFDIEQGIADMMNQLTGDEPVPVDVDEYDDQIRVVADLPGAGSGDIDLRCNGRVLAIRATTESGRYINQIDLPSYVDEASIDRNFNNGVLEVTLTQATDPANIGYY